MNDKKECYWEPQGNGHYLTDCGELVFMRDYRERKLTVCKFCLKPLEKDTLLRVIIK